MKKSFIIAICMLISGCTTVNGELTVERILSGDNGYSLTGTSTPELNTISMSIDPQEVLLPLTDDFTASLAIRNTTDTIYACGTDYEIEVYKDHEWIYPPAKKPTEFAWHALRINIIPNETRTFNIRFFTSVYAYEPGLYRIKKIVINTNTSKSVMLCALFTIK